MTSLIPALPTPRHHPGFSLVEVMLVTALVAILMALATPSYRDFAMRSHRSQAIAGLLQAGACQERMRATTHIYDTRRCLPADDRYYRYRYEPPGRETTRFSIFAEPGAAQSGDYCGSLILDQDGKREVGNREADSARCWNGR
jgi:type IV pilus assembly protein PilE